MKDDIKSEQRAAGLVIITVLLVGLLLCAGYAYLYSHKTVTMPVVLSYFYPLEVGQVVYCVTIPGDDRLQCVRSDAKDAVTKIFTVRFSNDGEADFRGGRG